MSFYGLGSHGIHQHFEPPFGKIISWLEPQKWRFGSDDFLYFPLVISRFQPFIFQGVRIKTSPQKTTDMFGPCHFYVIFFGRGMKIGFVDCSKKSKHHCKMTWNTYFDVWSTKYLSKQSQIESHGIQWLKKMVPMEIPDVGHVFTKEVEDVRCTKPLKMNIGRWHGWIPVILVLILWLFVCPWCLHIF